MPNRKPNISDVFDVPTNPQAEPLPNAVRRLFAAVHPVFGLLTDENKKIVVMRDASDAERILREVLLAKDNALDEALRKANVPLPVYAIVTCSPVKWKRFQRVFAGEFAEYTDVNEATAAIKKQFEGADQQIQVIQAGKPVDNPGTAGKYAEDARNVPSTGWRTCDVAGNEKRCATTLNVGQPVVMYAISNVSTGFLFDDVDGNLVITESRELAASIADGFRKVSRVTEDISRSTGTPVPEFGYIAMDATCWQIYQKTLNGKYKVYTDRDAAVRSIRKRIDDRTDQILQMIEEQRGTKLPKRPTFDGGVPHTDECEVSLTGWEVHDLEGKEKTGDDRDKVLQNAVVYAILVTVMNRLLDDAAGNIVIVENYALATAIVEGLAAASAKNAAACEQMGFPPVQFACMSMDAACWADFQIKLNGKYDIYTDKDKAVATIQQRVQDNIETVLREFRSQGATSGRYRSDRTHNPFSDN